MGDDGRDDDAKKAYEGVLNIEQKFGTAKTSGDKVQSFLDRVRLRLKKEPFNIDLPDNDAVSILWFAINHGLNGFLFDNILFIPLFSSFISFCTKQSLSLLLLGASSFFFSSLFRPISCFVFSDQIFTEKLLLFVL